MQNCQTFGFDMYESEMYPALRSSPRVEEEEEQVARLLAIKYLWNVVLFMLAIERRSISGLKYKIQNSESYYKVLGHQIIIIAIQD